jgi:hypothetical protein
MGGRCRSAAGGPGFWQFHDGWGFFHNFTPTCFVAADGRVRDGLGFYIHATPACFVGYWFFDDTPVHAGGGAFFTRCRVLYTADISRSCFFTNALCAIRQAPFSTDTATHYALCTYGEA